MLTRLLLDPDPAGTDAGVGTSVPSPSADVRTSETHAQQTTDRGVDWSGDQSTDQSSGVSDAGSGGAATGGGGVAPAPAGSPAPAPSWTSIREAAAAQGYTGLQQYQSDADALAHLLRQSQAYQQAQYNQRLAAQFAPQQPQVQPQPAQAQRNAYEPPPFDERWFNLVDQDPNTGAYLAKPGVDPRVAEQVTQYVEWQRNFIRNPNAVLDSYAQSKVPTMVQAEVERILAQRDQQSAVQEIQRANQDWLYARDPAGNLARDYAGRLMPSPEGSRYLQILQELAGAGVRDVRSQNRLAIQQLRGEIAYAQLTAAQPAASPQQQASAQQRSNRNPLQALPSLQRDNTQGAVAPPIDAGSLRDSLRQSLQSNGVTDADVAASISGV